VRVGNVGPRVAPAIGSPEWESWIKKTQPGTPTKEALAQLMDPKRRMQPGEVDSHIVDQNSVLCADGRYQIFLDMYRCVDAAAALAPPGFTLAR
jgi:hypothetical protein